MDKVIKCNDCGIDVIRTHPKTTRCEECQIKKTISRGKFKSRRWRLRNPLRYKQRLIDDARKQREETKLYLKEVSEDDKKFIKEQMIDAQAIMERLRNEKNN